jgi:transposase
MPNWNSKEQEHQPVKKEETQAKERQAISLFGEGCSVRHISKIMGLSISRINEYLRKEYTPNKGKTRTGALAPTGVRQNTNKGRC